MKPQRFSLSLILVLAANLSWAADQPKPAPQKAETENKGSDFFGADGMFDVSNFLKKKYGFFAMPVIMTSPALGNGGGLHLMYLDSALTGTYDEETKRYIPPSMTGAVAIATENGTKVGGAYHIGFWKKDTIRTMTFLGAPDAFLDFYPNKDYLPKEMKVTMNLKGLAGYQELKVRYKNSNWFLGGDYTYIGFDTEPKNKTGIKPLDELMTQDTRLSGLSLKALYDTRNSIFTPDQGLFGQVRVTNYNKAIGSQSEFTGINTKAFYFQPVTKKFFMGYRLELNGVEGEAPFYMYPYVDLRGIPSVRYQGQYAMQGELQGKYKVTDRFSLVLFGGSGTVFGKTEIGEKTNFGDADWRWTKGTGLRYTIASDFKMDVGFDYAWGPEDQYFYLQFGSAWNGWF